MMCIDTHSGGKAVARHPADRVDIHHCGERVDLTENVVLQMTDLVTARKCAVRIDASDLELTLERLLDKYIKNPQTSALLDDRRITERSAETLAAIQDLVYLSSDSGQLGAMFSKKFRHQGEASNIPGGTQNPPIFGNVG